jgi:hypothetical protein
MSGRTDTLIRKILIKVSETLSLFKVWRAEKNRETEMPWGDEALRAGVRKLCGRTLFAKSRSRSHSLFSKKVRAWVTIRAQRETSAGVRAKSARAEGALWDEGVDSAF